MPTARQDGELAKLATQLGEDIAVLRKELKEFAGVMEDAAIHETEPWPEVVDIAELLEELRTKIARYVVIAPHQMTASVLWAAHCWLYDHGVPTHSPMLAMTSAEPDSGKTTVISVVGHATPRFKLGVEMTGPTLYRYVDRFKPTMMLDEGDDLFRRRSDLKHVVNAGWTRGTKIPRQEKIGGVWTTVYFDPFTPKAIALLGDKLPGATRSRCIELRMVPKRSDEKVDEFGQVDDAEFGVLRRKFARWAADNAAALKDANPMMPPGLNNRAAVNWKLLLAIAELAGGPWPERAGEAAERLTRSRRRPSDGRRLLAAIRTMLIESGKREITSEAIVANLCEDPTDLWCGYNRGGPITQRQVAFLLDAFDIQPQQLHPTGRGDFSRRGYRADQFVDAFMRYVPDDPIIQSLDRQGKPPARKKQKQRARSEKRRR